MAKLVLYRQARNDGGVRTGIDVDESAALEDFVDGNGDHDPALKWYIDVRCEGEQLPPDPIAAWKWFSVNASYFRAALGEVADHLELGLDSEILPFQKQFCGPDAGVAVEIAISAVRRMQAREVAREIRALADGWEVLLASLLSPSSLGRRQ